MFWAVNYFVRDFYREYGPFERVLDVGSRDINGTVVQAFRESKKELPKSYVGIDMIEGSNVDIVLNGHDIHKMFPNPIFDLVTCCETLEHDNKFWLTVEQMRKVLKPGGYLLITAPGINFFHHDYPSDYYRFTEEAFKDVIFEGFEDVSVTTHSDPNMAERPHNTVMGFGRKPK